MIVPHAETAANKQGRNMNLGIEGRTAIVCGSSQGLGLALNGAEGIWGIAGDTDGIDGMDDIAGAVLTPDSFARARARGIDPRERLSAHDSHGFFDSLGDALRTGPTLTNVNDFRAILIV